MVEAKKPRKQDGGVLGYNPHKGTSISLMSTESENTNYRGFLNLAVLIILVTNFRLALENLEKYGLLIRSPHLILLDPEMDKIGVILIGMGGIMLSSFILEAYIAPAIRNQNCLINLISVTICALCYVFPLVASLILGTKPLFTLFMLMATGIGSIKIISFAHYSHNVRHAFIAKNTAGLEKDIAAEVMKYPNCITFSRFIYFICAPTCVFQFNYPRSDSIRWVWLFKRVVELICV
jgi:diacylglycerol O-acyltransferase-1